MRNGFSFFLSFKLSDFRKTNRKRNSPFFRLKKKKKNAAVHADDPEYRHFEDISELPKHRLNEIRRFFEDYKKNENKDVKVREFESVFSFFSLSRPGKEKRNSKKNSKK